MYFDTHVLLVIINQLQFPVPIILSQKHIAEPPCLTVQCILFVCTSLPKVWWYGNLNENKIGSKMLILNILSFKYTIISLFSIDIDVVVVQLLNHVKFFATPWTAARQASLSFTISWSLLKIMSIESVIPSKHLIFCLPISPPAFSISQHQSLFQSLPFHPVAKILELQHQSLQWIFRVDFTLDLLVLSPYCPRDCQKSSSALHFEGINSSTLSVFYCPVLTPIQEYRKNHSFDYADLCQQSNVSAF